ncbi:MAG: hypothetical protein ACYCWW_00090 [Deltaproteobacteria bacterium]
MTDQAGNQACAVSCTGPSQCAASTPCCAPLPAGGSACIGNGVFQGQTCRCSVSNDCSGGCCAPQTDSSGNPIGPYICKANDAAPYDCCTGFGNDCGSGFCCVADSSGNEFCASQCTNDSQCGAAHCDQFNFSHTSCGGPTACGL